jgi:hypothetical protein
LRDCARNDRLFAAPGDERVILRAVAGSTRNEIGNDKGGTSVNSAAPGTF